MGSILLPVFFILGSSTMPLVTLGQVHLSGGPSAPLLIPKLRPWNKCQRTQRCSHVFIPLVTIGQHHSTAGALPEEPGKAGRADRAASSPGLFSMVWRKLCLPISPSSLREATGEGRSLGQTSYNPCRPIFPEAPGLQ